jgi:glycosyltransferase involved in cell wall biosynthesis
LVSVDRLSRRKGFDQVIRACALLRISAEDLPRWYNAADLVAMPTGDIFGDTKVSAWCISRRLLAGKPTIAGLSGTTGKRLGEQGRVRAFSWQKVAERTRELYPSLLA